MSFFEYSHWDGTQDFQPISAESVFDKLSEYLLEYGEHVLRRLEHAAEDDQEVLELLVKEGYLEQDEEGKYAVAVRGVRRMEDKAVRELFQAVKKGSMGKHETDFKGSGQVVHEDSKPYEYGDPVANLNMHETLKNGFLRGGFAEGRIQVSEDDFVVHETEYQTRCSTVLLIDMSGSMARYGKFHQAKKVALALHGMVRGQFSQDWLQSIGFYTYASPMSEREIVRAAPKPVSIYDSRVFMRINLDQPPKFVPEHFTNIQAGLKFARQALKRRPEQYKQIICVTDGEPTAHVEGREVVLIYPPSERTARATLEEVRRCTQEGIRISTFALVDDPYYLGLVNFVNEMARLNKGIAVYCDASTLGAYVLDSFVKGHRTRRHVG